MYLLCIDLSLNSTGYAVLQYEEGDLELVEKGIVNNSKIPAARVGAKLSRIADKITELCSRYIFDVVVKEASFNTGHITSTQRTHQAFGVVLETLYKLGYEELQEVAATTVKKYVGGNGKANKDIVAKALPQFVGRQRYKTDDESDAVAVGIAYLLKNKSEINLRLQ